jgi:hypothetical protein
MAHALHKAICTMMTRSPALALVLAFGTATGCAASSPQDDDYTPGDGSGSGSADIPLTAEGKFTIESTFDVATNLPGTAGEVINGIIDATDSPDDPTHWILDRLVNTLPDGSLKNTIKNAIPFLSGYLNDRLLSVAPQFVLTMRDVGNKFGQVARNFGTIETIEINAAGQATKVVQGVQFTIDQVELPFMFKDYMMTDVTVMNVPVMLEPTGRLSIGEHKVGLTYGKLMRLALDEVVLPMIDPTAVTLTDLLKKSVNCQAVGQYIYEALDIGTASTFQAACTSGLQAAGGAVYSLINKVDDNAFELSINGIARGIDKNHDGKMDEIQTGAWTGTLGFASQTPVPLARGTFVGTKSM